MPGILAGKDQKRIVLLLACRSLSQHCASYLCHYIQCHMILPRFYYHVSYIPGKTQGRYPPSVKLEAVASLSFYPCCARSKGLVCVAIPPVQAARDLPSLAQT